MPARLLGELDLAIAAERVHDRWFNRSQATAVALRRFLDHGGIASLGDNDPLIEHRGERRRSTQFHLPVGLIIEYMSERNVHLSRNEYWHPWEVVATAIRLFLDQGAMALMGGCTQEP